MNQDPHHSPLRSIAPACLAIAGLVAMCATVCAWGPRARPPRPGAAWAFASLVSPDPGAEGATPPDENREGITECVITLLSGRTITGELVRQDELIVVIGVEGIDTTFQKKKVANVRLLPPVAERYEQMRAAIADDDIDARLSLVEWLRARKAYSLAYKELDTILIIDPNNPRARLLHTWLAEYGKLRRAKPGGDEPGHDGARDAGTGEDEPENDQTGQPGDAGKLPDDGPANGRDGKITRNEFPTLTPEQINLMRVYEIDLRNPPEFKVPDEVIAELMTRFPAEFSPNENERKQVYAWPELDKLKLLFKLKARDLYPRVKVLGTPDSLERFRHEVHNGRGWLINACASTRCHGGAEAGSLRLLNTRPNSEETAFTNLYILEHTTLDDGTPLIDFKSPDRSPLLQMGMIRGNALTPHPEIPDGYPGMGYRPIFRTTRDRKYQQAIDWIRSMYQPRPDYGFEYDPARGEPDQAPPAGGP